MRDFSAVVRLRAKKIFIRISRTHKEARQVRLAFSVCKFYIYYSILNAEIYDFGNSRPIGQLTPLR